MCSAPFLCAAGITAPDMAWCGRAMVATEAVRSSVSARAGAGADAFYKASKRRSDVPLFCWRAHAVSHFRVRIWLLCFVAAPALAQGPDTRTPEQVMMEAYGRLMKSPAQVDKRFWAPERWYTQATINWIGSYERCKGRSPPVWYDGQGEPKLTDVDLTPVPPSGEEAQVLVSLKDRGLPEQRIFFFLRENGAWRISDVMASGGRSLITSQPACR